MLGDPSLDEKHNPITVSQEMAFVAWIASGPATDIRDLQALLQEIYGEAPTQRQLKRWHHDYSWEKRRQIHFDRLKSQVLEIVGTDAERMAESVEYLKSIKGKLLQMAYEMLTGEGDGSVPRLKLKGNIQELKLMMQISVEVSTHIELLSGNPTSIVENRNILQDIDDRELLDQFSEYVDVEYHDDSGGGGPRQITHEAEAVPEELH